MVLQNICGGRETSSVGKKSGGETAPKRARNETSSTLPPFKVFKFKLYKNNNNHKGTETFKFNCFKISQITFCFIFFFGIHG